MYWHDRRGVIQFAFIAAVLAAIVGTAITVGIPTFIMLTNKDRTVVTPNEVACDCPDQLMMRNRLAQANAAIQSIDSLINAQSAKDAQAGSPEMYSDGTYATGRAANEQAVNNAAKGDRIGDANTPSRNCSPDVSNGQTECMRASLQAHENVHQRECLAFDSRPRNYKYAKTMVDYWKEDREGYEKEVDYLDRHIKRLDLKCKPKVSTYLGGESKEDQKQRLAGSGRRVTKYAKTIG